MNVVIYTDGSVSNNGKPDAIGGWACILQAYKGDKLISEVEKSGRLVSADDIPITNNRAEMEAVLNALKCIAIRCDIKLYSDSELVVKILNKEYSKRNNLDLWEKIEETIFHIKDMKCSLEVIWVKGHAGDKMNIRVDKLASNAKKGIK